MWITSL